MNEVIDTIKKRRSIRKFTDIEVNEENLALIVEAGRFSPTGGNCQSVHFTVITNKELLEQLREKVKEVFSRMELKEEMYISLKHSITLANTGKYIYDYGAPILIIVSNKKGYPNAIADSACAIQNMMLAATSLNVGSCWINQLHWLQDEKQIRDLLVNYGIGYDEEICGSLALGNFDGEFHESKRTGMKVDWVK